MRVLVPPGSLTLGGTIELDEEESHHLAVRRAHSDELVELLDGAGGVARGKARLRGRVWIVEVDAVELRPPLAPLTIAVGAGDRDHFGWLVEKAAELGVTTVVPLETERTQAVATRLRDRHVPKLRWAALQAIKQSGSAWAPAIEAPGTLERFLARAAGGARLLADVGGDDPPVRLDEGPAVVLIGPEGGFTNDERSLIDSAGYAAIALGRFTLRFETAAVAAAAAVAIARGRSAHG
ncbi:MAG: 16S rRNA (uracil(1498)-N(3))-methyltransferase [Gemmatimonadales bacterium]|nr:16S rRNA (uracil(1498)-N(3))-methyltransferase [Gemmatimonadales bacterium]